MSSEHFPVCGTMVGAWASQKSLRLRGEGSEGGGGEMAEEIPGGTRRVTLAAAVYNLARMRNLMAGTA